MIKIKTGGWIGPIMVMGVFFLLLFATYVRFSVENGLWVDNLWMSALVGMGMIICLFFCVWDGIAHFKNIIFDSQGCTLQYLWITKNYTWAEFITKRYEDFSDARCR